MPRMIPPRLPLPSADRCGIVTETQVDIGFGYAIANSLFGGTAPLLLHASRRADAERWFAVSLCDLIAITLGAALSGPGRRPGGRFA